MRAIVSAVRVLPDNYFFQSGKALTEPLFVLTAVALALSVYALWRAKERRSTLALLAVSIMILAGLGTDVAADALLQSLALAPAPDGMPEVIVVAGGGAAFGGSRETDVLAGETASRVVTGVEAWRRHPKARLVMAGAQLGGPGPASRMVELMRDAAICRGVPAPAIAMDPSSVNTREHALRLRRMPGIAVSTRVGIATSFWHMRRTLRVFRRFFTTVIPYPTRQPRPPYTAVSFLPNATALMHSTEAIHEWLGIAWYAFRDAFDDPDSAVGSPDRLQR